MYPGYVRVHTGVMTFQKSALVYSGTFCRGLWEGHGTLVYPNGDSFEGRFQQGQKQGEGKFQWADGACYEGEYQANKWHGRGRWVRI